MKRYLQKNLNVKIVLLFILFQITLGVLLGPFILFYGPFSETKKTVVGSAWTSLTKRFVPKLFLSDEAITKIMGGNFNSARKDGTKVDETQVVISDANSNKIDLCEIKGLNQGKALIIHDPRRVVVGVSEKLPLCGEKTSTIAKRNNAVAAINACGFFDDTTHTGTGGNLDGFLISNYVPKWGENYQDKTEEKEVVAIKEDGRMLVGVYSLEKLLEMKVKEAVCFGPPLIVNGIPRPMDQYDGIFGIAPRTAIGQKKTGEIVFLVLDGRQLTNPGAKLSEVQKILLDLEVVNASNLDGGSSTTMYYKGKVINHPSDAIGERSVPGVFMVKK